MVESKKLDGFHNGFLPMGEDVDVSAIRYKTLAEVPVCIVEGDKKPEDWFTPEADLHRVWFYPFSEDLLEQHAEKFRALSPAARANPLLVKHYKPGEIEKRLEREKAELFSGTKKAPSALSLLSNAQSDEDIVRVQAGNNGYRFFKKNFLGQPEEKSYELCRSAQPDKSGFPLWTYREGEHKVFDKEKCQANASAFFAPVEAIRDNLAKLAVIAAGNLQSPDYCVADSLWISSSENGVYRLDQIIAPRIQESGLSDAQAIVDHMQAAQVGTRINMERKDKMEENQVRAMSHSKYAIIGATAVNVLALLWISGKIRIGRILKKIRNISAEARSGALGEPKHWMGMNEDLKRMADIMGAPEINSVRTIGPNGSGKSARWEALAVCIERGHFPDGTPIPKHLKGKTVYELVPKSHIMGESDSSFIGSAERFIRRVARAVSKRGDILHVDEAHTLHNLAATGATAESGGAEEGLKPMMARKGKKGKKARLGFSSTEEEYNRSIGRNKALHGRTVPVDVSEPTPQQTLVIMRHKQELYEKDALRKINDSALQEAVALTQTDTDTHYPRKAEKLLGLAYQKAGPKEEITAKHVEAAARDLVEKAVRKASDNAILARNEAELYLEPKEQARLRMESITKVIGERVEGFEGTLDGVQTSKMERLVDIVNISWERALQEAPMIRSVHKPSPDPRVARYGIPEGFTLETLQNCAAKERLILKLASRGKLPPTRPAGGDGGPSATSGTGSADEGRAARQAGPAESDHTANRTRLVEERAPRGETTLETAGGLAAIGGLFAIGATLRHNNVISEKQKAIFDNSIFGIFAYFSPVALIGALPGAAAGHAGGSYLAEKTGLQSLLPDWIPAKEITGIGGGLAGFALNERLNHKLFGRHYRELSEAGRLGMQHTVRTAVNRIGAAGEVIEEGLTHTARNVSIGLRTAGQQVAQTARQVAAATQTAWQAGANLARQAAPVLRQAAQQVRNVTVNAAPGALMMGPAVAVLKGGAAVSGAAAAAAGTALVAGGILAAGAGVSYYAVKSKTGEFWADEFHSTKMGQWAARKIYGWFLR